MSEHVTQSRPITNCQICDSKNLESVLFLGYLPPVNAMPLVGTPAVEEPAFPLELLRCTNCSLVQIGSEVDPDVLFPPSYPYRSASTRILRTNFAELRTEAANLLGLKGTELVADIGSNDGTLLRNFKEAGHPVIGIEPSDAARDAHASGIPTVQAFFNAATAKLVRAEHGPAHVITAANVFAHIPAVNDIVDAVIGLLDEDGVFITESHYLGGLVETLQYDTIYHEHLRHYSVISLRFLFERHGLEIFHVTQIPTHGGSIRVYAGRKGARPVDDSVRSTLAAEEKAGLGDGRALVSFKERIVQSKLDLYALLTPLHAAGAKIYGVGAPSRASTLIKYIGLDDGILAGVLEVGTSKKVGRYIPGTRIPVIDEAILETESPEYLMLLSWHIADELITNLRKKGYRGRFIVPLPHPRIVE